MSAFRDEDGTLVYDAEYEDWLRENAHRDFSLRDDPDHRHPLERMVDEDDAGDY